MNSSELSSSLRTTVATLHKMLRKQSASVSEYSLTERETVGHLMRHTFLLPTELASLTRIKTQSMSHILNRLEKQGVIKRKPSKTDKRKIYVSITPSGKKLVEKARHEWDEWLRTAIEKSLNSKEKELLAKAIPVLRKLTETN